AVVETLPLANTRFALLVSPCRCDRDRDPADHDAGAGEEQLRDLAAAEVALGHQDRIAGRGLHPRLERVSVPVGVDQLGLIEIARGACPATRERDVFGYPERRVVVVESGASDRT